jgi:geranylgeranyl diphosphate synthase type I/geranylgeranyl diphosphate synthase type II
VGLAEIIHSASLVLDDISDDSLLRRGAPSAHQRYGTQVAGASGSSWLNIGCEIAWRDRDALGPEATHRLIQALSWEHFVTGLGTTIDVTWAWLADPHHTADEYLQQVLHRSTSYTYRLPMKIGGLAAGADGEDLEHLSGFGEQVGLAFQLVDDVLNAKPGDGHWGKEIGEDISQGKVTLQVIIALQRSTPENRRRLLAIHGSQTHEQSLLQEAASLIERTGAFEDCLRLASDQASRAREHVEALKIDAVYKDHLLSLSEYVLRRHR